MPGTKYQEMNLEDFDAYGAELRGGLQELSEGDRSEGEWNDKYRRLLQEVELYDRAFTIALRQSEGERAAHILQQQHTAPNVATDPNAGGLRSVGAMITESDEYRDWVRGGFREQFTIPFDGAFVGDNGLVTDGTRAVITEFGTGGPGNNATGSINSLLPVGQPMYPVPRQARLYMRDLIPTTGTTLSQIPYVRELNPTTNEAGATSVSEGAVKPEATIAFTPDTALVTVLAVNVTVTTQLAEDAPGVMDYLNTRLSYLLRVREDAEIINGSGLWPDLKGIKQFSGLQTQSATAGDPAVTIGNSAAKVELVDGQANGVVMNPTDAWTMFLKRAAGGSGNFDAGSPFSNNIGALSVWGLPVVRSRVYTAGHALVGDFARGAMIFDRRQAAVQLYAQHSDYAVRNQVLVQAEERLALAVFRPDYFVDATL